MPFSPAMRQSAHVCSKLVLGNGVPTDKTAFTENKNEKQMEYFKKTIKICPLHIKNSLKATTQHTEGQCNRELTNSQPITIISN